MRGAGGARDGDDPRRGGALARSRRTWRDPACPWVPHADRWPHFAALATGLGVRGAYAFLPVTAGRAPVGVLTLLATEAGRFPADDLPLVSSPAAVTPGSAPDEPGGAFAGRRAARGGPSLHDVCADLVGRFAGPL
ncbi:hypothetical protein SAMN05216499_114133 [Actinacidiphila paucisporea]|uniref:GAF domain-containing protein n=1 Tax=Actinacidiphila paucisporea TaxID=310782 RepID=A0A1M7LRM5_9ACTN|nr:hypothetical protein SAMN05216499_114133 [Actinacidiphila paucisporea]